MQHKQAASQARENPMIRHPVFDFVTGAMLAMGGPMALMLPQRIFFEMLANAAEPYERQPVTEDGSA
jgi:hypothetical protein